MADRYWVGGNGEWNDPGGTKWALTSGGTGGQAVPTSADDVYFDANSGSAANNCIVSSAAVCKNLNFTGYVGILSGSSSLTASGSVTFSSGMTLTYSGLLTMVGAGTVLTTNGKALNGGLTLDSPSAGIIDLADALSLSGVITVTQATFRTNNFGVTAIALSSSNSNTRTISLGSSTVSLNGSFPITFTDSTNLTLLAGTSSLACGDAGPTFAGGGLTFYNVSFANTSIITASITGANTFNNLTIAGRASTGVSLVRFFANQTINGTLTLSSGTDPMMRTFVRSDATGTTRTLTCAAVASLTDIDFQDITIAGAAAPVSGTRLGDCKGNSGITFPAAKTVYYAVAGGTWTTALAWSFTSGGAGNATAFPLAQDTAVFPSATPASGQSITVTGGFNVGSIDMSLRTSNTMTLTPLGNIIYGNWINGTGVTLSGLSTLTFSGRGSQTITSAGRTFTQTIVIRSPGGSVTLLDAFVSNRSNSLGFILDSGTFNLSSFTATLSGSTIGFRADQTTNARTLATSTGTLVIAGSTGFQSTATGFTVTGSGTISLTSASGKNFIGSGIQTYPTINQGGAGTLTITGSNKFADITNTYAATGATTVLFAFGAVNEFTAFNLSGQATRVCTLGSSSASQTTLRKSTPWLVGANSTNGGNNSGLTFSGGGGIDYLNISYINGVDTSAVFNSFFAFF